MHFIPLFLSIHWSFIANLAEKDQNNFKSNFISFLYSDMFIAAGEFVKAAEILGENGWTEKYMIFISLCVCRVFVPFY